MIAPGCESESGFGPNPGPNGLRRAGAPGYAVAGAVGERESYGTVRGVRRGGPNGGEGAGRGDRDNRRGEGCFPIAPAVTACGR